MTYSDLYLTSKVKIEILPTDKLEQKTDFFVVGDRLISVFRPIHTPEVADFLNKVLFAEFYSHHKQDKLPISETLKTAIQKSNISQLNFLGNPESAPESGAMVLIVYIDTGNQFTIAQVGNIALKQWQNGHFTTLTQDHTFDNPHEVEQLSMFLRLSGIGIKPEAVIKTIASDEGFTDQVPSRFIGHPSWCGWGGDYGETIINTQPFVTTFLASR
jgi:hypothetical protein